MDGERLSGGLALWEQRKYERSGQVPFLLAERARSECARSTAAVGPARVPFHAIEASKLGGVIYIARSAQ